jgi:hypothetical protein
VIGYEAVRGGVRSLRLARLVEGNLVPAGSVGSGITVETSRALCKVLEAGQPVVADVEFRGWTPAGELRHAVLKGWHGGNAEWPEPHEAPRAIVVEKATRRTTGSRLLAGRQQRRPFRRPRA